MGSAGECRSKSCGPPVADHCAVLKVVCKYPIIHLSREQLVSSHGIGRVKILEVEENSF
jgi:hypothetical protein